MLHFHLCAKYVCYKLQTIILLLWTMLIYSACCHNTRVLLRCSERLLASCYVAGVLPDYWPKQQEEPTPKFGEMAQAQPSACMGFPQRFIVENSKFVSQNGDAKVQRV